MIWVRTEWVAVAYLAQQASCRQYHTPHHRKGPRPIVYRTLCRARGLPNDRLFHYLCQPHPRRTFSPLADILSECTAAEGLYLEARFAFLLSYVLTIKFLEKVLPLDGFNMTSVRNHLQAVI
jgi:hypothetical protein